MSTNRDDLVMMKPEIETVKDEEVVGIPMPHKFYLHGVTVVNSNMYKHKGILEAGKMDFKKVEKHEVITGACRELHSKATAITLPTSEAQKEWEESRDEAELVAYDIHEAALYACRDNPDLLGKITYINQGSSYPDLFQDLNDYSVFGRENAALFEAIGYDMSNFERAAVLSKILSKLYAQVIIDRSASPELTLLRDKAFTLLKKSTDELLAQARYIFRNNKKTAGEFFIPAPRRKPVKKEENVTVTA